MISRCGVVSSFQPPLETRPCRLSVTNYSVYSQLLPISWSHLFHPQSEDPHNTIIVSTSQLKKLIISVFPLMAFETILNCTNPCLACQKAMRFGYSDIFLATKQVWRNSVFSFVQVSSSEYFSVNFECGLLAAGGDDHSISSEEFLPATKGMPLS
jgi:hypothetical protein